MKLTMKDVETLRKYAQGLSQAEIAKLSNVKSATIQKRCQRICDKLYASNTVNAVYIATKSGLLGLLLINAIVAQEVLPPRSRTAPRITQNMRIRRESHS